MAYVSALFALCIGNTLVTGDRFTAQKDKKYWVMMVSLLLACISFWTYNRLAGEMRHFAGDIFKAISKIYFFCTLRQIYNESAFAHVMAWHETRAWWRHQMETFSALLAICAGNSPVPGAFPTQRPVTRSFDVWVNNGNAGDLRHHRAHYDVIVMEPTITQSTVPVPVPAPLHIQLHICVASWGLNTLTRQWTGRGNYTRFHFYDTV